MNDYAQLDAPFYMDTPSTMSTKKVLLVDSNLSIAQEIGQAITALNHLSLGCVRDIQSIERRIAIKKPDLIIINIETKGPLDGYQLAKLIKLDVEIPFCILCKEECSNLKKWAYELNPDGIITYSNDHTSFVAQLDKMLN